MSQAGSFRRRVWIQQQVTVQDSTGSAVPTWKTLWKAVPCSILGNVARGREAFAGQQVQADVPWRIVMRWRPGLDASMRLVEYKNADRTQFVVYNIEAVLPDATDRRELTVLCRTRLSEGFRSDGA